MLTNDHVDLRPALALAVVLAVIVVAVFLPATGFGFVNLDDQTYVYENTMVLRGLTWEGFVWSLHSFHGSNWHPLTWLSHMLDVELFGLDAPRHHVVSIVVHAATSALLLVWLRMATGALWRSGVAAALFAVHPLRVESVVWISERKDVLVGFFWIAALIAYSAWVRRRGPGRYALVVGAFVLALLSKPMAVTLPLTLLLVDAWPMGRLGGLRSDEPFDARRIIPLVREKLPLLALSAASALVTWFAQRDLAASRMSELPMGERLANAAVACVAYLRQTIWPTGLAALYPHPYMAGPGIPAWQIASSVVLLVGISTAVVLARRAHPYLPWGWLWFVGTLVPVLGLVQVGVQSRADRYTYVPSIGIVVAATWLVAAVAVRARGSRIAAAVAAVVAVATLGLAARSQARYWRDSETLWRRTLSVTPGNWQAWTGLGDALFEAGRPVEAMEAHRRSLRIWDGNPLAWNGLGVCLGQLGLHADAIDTFERAVALDPGYADAWYNMGTAHGNVGEHARAVAALSRAAALRPADPRIWANLAIAKAALGDTVGAKEALSRLEQLDPAKAAEMRRR